MKKLLPESFFKLPGKQDFKLRPWRLEDIESLTRHANNWNIAKYMKDVFPHPYSKESAQQFIEKVAMNNPETIFAIEVNDEAIGAIGFYKQTDIYCKNAEIGYWLAEPYWGKGIVTKALKLVVDYAFKKQDVTRIYASIFESNKASAKVLKNAGFKHEATLKNSVFKSGKYSNELVFSKLKKE